MQSFFYDNQIRRFLLQFARIFSNFEVEYGVDDTTGGVGLYRIPVRYGDVSKQAQTILQNNSANSIPNTPLMTFYVTGLNYARDRVQEPYFVDKKHFRQRTWIDDPQSPDGGYYEQTQGNAFTVERIMPVPYTLELQLDIWTSNTTQKLQILEQILTLFNPSLEIQSTDNYIDWTSLSVVELSSTTWSNRSVPVGTDEPIDIASLRFTLPIWISPPAKVKKLGVIQKIIASLYDSGGDRVPSEAVLNNDLLLGNRVKITPYDYDIIVLNAPGAANPFTVEVQAVANNELDRTDENDVSIVSLPTPSWESISDEAGGIRDGITQIRIDNPHDDSVIVGIVTRHPTDESKLIAEIDEDTVPANTLPPVDAIVDPQRKWPGEGLPLPALGQRYLLVGSAGNDGGDVLGWRGTLGDDLIASINNIIEYDGTKWVVAFDTSEETEYVTNITTGIQYRYVNGQWLKSFQGLFQSGEWYIII